MTAAEAAALVFACREVVEADDIIDRNRSPTGGVPDYADMNWDLAVERLRDALRSDADEKLASLLAKLRSARLGDIDASSAGLESWPRHTMRVVDEFLVSEKKKEG